MTKPPESRFDEIRLEAERTGRAVPIAGYYGLPLLKQPVWTWEVPLYFFVGGAAGAAAIIGAAAQITNAEQSLVRHARWVAAAGATLSAPLLITDLGRPERFLYMLRVFKPQSPMSVGAWTLAAFGAASTAAVIAPWRPLRSAAAIFSAATGLVLSTYTGVLLGVTSVPAWSKNAPVLPLQFGASGLAAAASLLELMGHRERALHAIATGATIVETATGTRTATTGTNIMRIAKLVSGPIPIALRLLGTRNARKAAAVATLLGSLLTRIAWVEAGRKSKT
ncbi:MAG: NrfD/PsrC family molybdoenzyme membrane anchor subunit [Thermoanaerobaculia bacterium]